MRRKRAEDAGCSRRARVKRGCLRAFSGSRTKSRHLRGAPLQPPRAPGWMALVAGDGGARGRSSVGMAKVRAAAKKVSCEDCYFRCNLLCALDLDEPCATFRPDHPEGLRPPRQMRFHFRQERRTQAAWAFPTAAGAGRAAPLSGPDTVCGVWRKERECGSRSSESLPPGRTPAARAAGTSSRRATPACSLDCGNGVFAKLRRYRDYIDGRCGRRLAPARRPLPRPRPVRLRADLRAAPAAGARRRLAGHRRPRPPAPATRRRGARDDVPPRRRRVGQRGPHRDRLRPARSTTPGDELEVGDAARALPRGPALHADRTRSSSPRPTAAGASPTAPTTAPNDELVRLRRRQPTC